MFWFSSKSKKFDVNDAISARRILIWNQLFFEKRHVVVIVYVPSSYLFERIYSFFLPFYEIFFDDRMFSYYFRKNHEFEL